MEVILAYLAAAIVGIAITAVLVRFIFRVDSTYNVHKANFDLLSKMAEKQGVSKGDIEVIKRTYRLDR